MSDNNQSNMKSNHIKSDDDRIRCDQKVQEINAYADLVKENIDFDVLLQTYSREQDLVEEIYQLQMILFQKLQLMHMEQSLQLRKGLNLQ